MASSTAKMNHIEITKDILDIGRISDLVTVSSTGATSIFVGTTRDNFQGKQVVRLEYEAYVPMAKKELEKLCAGVRERTPDLQHIAIFHRLGLVGVTEASVVIAVSSPHRKSSLEAVHVLIDELKAKVPIWKKEVYAEDTRTNSAWKENAECAWAAKKEDTTDVVVSETAVDDGDEVMEIDKDLVQITAPKAEIDRRIDAFISRKRDEINGANVLEFCNRHVTEESEFSCARTDSVVQRKKDSRSHLRQSQVVNSHGPLVDDGGGEGAGSLKDKDPLQHSMSKKVKQEPGEVAPPPPHGGVEQPHYLPEGLQERLTGLESRVLLAPGKPVPKDIYARLRALEDRVRYIEGISPEYLDVLEVRRDAVSNPHPRHGLTTSDLDEEQLLRVKSEARSEDISKSLCGINSRIQELQASLKTSASKSSD